MLHPSYYDLMEVVNSSAANGEEPVVSSRYSIVIATSKRARQIIDGDEAMVSGNYKKPLSLAVDEINQGKVKILPEGTEIDYDSLLLEAEEELARKALEAEKDSETDDEAEEAEETEETVETEEVVEASEVSEEAAE